MDSRNSMPSMKSGRASLYPDSDSIPNFVGEAPFQSLHRASQESYQIEGKLAAPFAHKSGAATHTKVEGGRGKRSRVTTRQLEQLESYFLLERSPTAAKRREISDLLGMHERQTQIWFQNRRAKAKTQDERNKGRKDVVTNSATNVPPPQFSTGFEYDIHNLIHEDEAVTIIPCTELSIGSWRRISLPQSKHDLVAYVCEVRRCLTWFIHSAGSGFKMEIPFATITEAGFKSSASGSGIASFLLDRPPLFYLENASSLRHDDPIRRRWKRCSDWTEGQQASLVLRHNVIGSAIPLNHFIRGLHIHQDSSDIQRRSPLYQEEPLPPSSSSQVPLTGCGYDASNTVVVAPVYSEDDHGQGELKSYVNPQNLQSASFIALHHNPAPPTLRPHTYSLECATYISLSRNNQNALGSAAPQSFPAEANYDSDVYQSNRSYTGHY